MHLCISVNITIWQFIYLEITDGNIDNGVELK